MVFSDSQVLAQSGILEAHVESVVGVAHFRSNLRSGVVSRNVKLVPGDVIQTNKNSRVVISLNDGSQVVVYPNSMVQLKNYDGASSARELLEILLGRVRVKIQHVGGKPNPYRLNSPAASIAVRGTEFIVDVQSSGETLVEVYEGLVEVASRTDPSKKRLITPGSNVVIRPGGEIGLAVPGPGSELNGRSKLTQDIGEAYQSSINSLVQNSVETPPSLFLAFPDSHFDSLDNPAYAADFTQAQGRLSLLQSISDTDRTVIIQTPSTHQNSDLPPRFNYTFTPQLSFFTPIPNTRLILGASVSGARTSLVSLSRYTLYDDPARTKVRNLYSEYKNASVNALDSTFTAAYRLGEKETSSIGIELEHLSGNGAYLRESVAKVSGNGQDYSNTYTLKSKADFARNRVTFGYSHDFSRYRRLGLYYRYGVTSSNQQNLLFPNQASGSPGVVIAPDFRRAVFSTTSMEAGVRWRSPLTRRLFYGVEGSYLSEMINGRYPIKDPHAAALLRSDFIKDQSRSWRARFGGGLGYVIRSKTVLSLDVSGGLYGSKPLSQEHGKFIAAHAAMQTDLWRHSFISASFLMNGTYRLGGVEILSSYPYQSGEFRSYYSSFSDVEKFSKVGAGWKFNPNLITEYLFSTDHSYRGPSHTLVLRYTFDVKITNEK